MSIEQEYKDLIDTRGIDSYFWIIDSFKKLFNIRFSNNNYDINLELWDVDYKDVISTVQLLIHDIDNLILKLDSVSCDRHFRKNAISKCLAIIEQLNKLQFHANSTLDFVKMIDSTYEM